MKKKTEPPTKWETDIKDWTKVSKDTANLFISQSEKCLNETVETSKSISSKADKILTILIPAITALVAYLCNTLFIIKKTDSLFVVGSLVLIVLLISIIFCYKNFVKYNVAVVGTYPNELVTSELIDADFSPENQFSNIALWLCENMKSGIVHNEITNARRMRNNTLAIRALLFIPLCPVAGYFLFRVLVNYCVLA